MEQMDFNMNGYRGGAGCDRGVRGGGHGEGTRGRSFTSDPVTVLSWRHVTCPVVAPQPGRYNNRNHLLDCAGQQCGAYVPLDLKPAQARPSATPPGCPTHLC